MDHESIANDLTHPKTSGYDYVVLAIFGSGWQLLTEAEKIYQESATADRSKYRPRKSKKCRRNVTVFFPGIHAVGKPYMMLIPFYVRGDVKINETSVELRSCYDVYGRCNLEIPTDGKLGPFIILDVE
ncbi:hypothetical protein, variant [Blastomyces dermatitidis ATCC 18188]|uniref:Uncharacterized protein n=1 Tax=Ajellomyces dermatitidis (strain ATCC 18188 / CBS 674.68) TaxID=653446 RepID=F2TTP8_AJEDA|nr:hypothetical protein BDDG_09557 [Blastomyces dermatitidis ATCC 18188]KMW69151.1 hypothetical protein, variant [Blastomyces dermatitidis ATCC 18188]